MPAKPVKILLVEDNPGDVRLIREALAEAKSSHYEVECVDRVSEAVERLTDTDIDLILLDLSLPDSRGLETFTVIHQYAPEVPIVVLTGLADDALALRGVREGAQDYLVKGQVEAKLLPRSIQYAIARHRTQGLLRAATLTDDLTNLYNRRGFMALADHQLRVAFRTRAKLALVFLDLDGLKEINDHFGHSEGDLALLEAAETLRETFRESDIMARLGGDEFVVLIIQTDQRTTENLVSRLERNIQTRNARPGRRYQLCLSVGVSFYDPEVPCSLGELMARADALMFRQKRCHREANSGGPAVGPDVRDTAGGKGGNGGGWLLK